MILMNTIPEVNAEMVRMANYIRELADEVTQMEEKLYGTPDRPLGKRSQVDDAENQAFLRAVGPIEQRKQEAKAEAWERGEATALALEAAIRGRKLKMKAAELELDAIRSAGNSLKTEMTTFTGTGP